MEAATGKQQECTTGDDSRLAHWNSATFEGLANADPSGKASRSAPTREDVI